MSKHITSIPEVLSMAAIEGSPDYPATSGSPRRVVQGRGVSQTCRLERVAGYGILGAQ